MKTRIFRLVTAIAVVFTFIGSVLSTTQPFTMFSANGAAVYDSDTLEKYDHEVADIVKLFAVIALMIFACMIVLRRLIGKMNITQALKLGED